MGARGPAAKPSVIRELQGNPGKRAVNRREPRPGVKERVPSAPRWLGEEARREWRRLAPLLHRAGLLTEVDGVALGMMCEALGMYRQAKQEMQGSGGAGEQGSKPELFVKSDKGNLYQHPAVGLMNSARADVLKWAREFGMTPAARSRIAVDGDGAGEPSLADALAAALFEGADRSVK